MRLLVAGSLCLCALACWSSERGQIAPPPRAAYNEVWTACRQRDVGPIWALAAPELQQQLDQRAAELARSLSAEELRKGFPGFRGATSEFTGRAYLDALLRTDDRLLSPCHGAQGWELADAVSEPPVHQFRVARPDGNDMLLTFVLRENRWRLRDLSRPVEVVREAPLPSPPCTWSGRYRFELAWVEQPMCPLGDVPRQIDVHMRRTGEETVFLKPGRTPTDWLEGPRCEFQFEGPKSGLPEGRRLAVEFIERRDRVEASARYGVMESTQAGVSTGCSVEVSVRATRAP